MAANGRPSQPEAGPLHGYTVVELSTGIAGAYCTKLLADGGAQVIKVESPQGDPLRSWSASGARIEPASDGALFGFLACSKHIVLCRDQLHQDRGVRTCAARNPSQRHSTRPHADRRVWDPKSATPSRWVGPVMSTRSPAPRYFSPRKWRAIPPGRPFTSTVEHRPPAAGTTTPKRAATTSGPAS